MVKYLKSRFIIGDGGTASSLSTDAGDGVLPVFRLIESDALDCDLDALFAGGITKVAANLPYSVASRLMVDISECRHRPVLMSLTIQKEVADRLTSPPGNKHYGLLGILTGVFYKNTMVKKISPSCFLPPPKIWSAVVKMERRENPVVDADTYPVFKKLVKHCFSQRRKQVGTILKHMGISPVDALVADAGIEHTERPEVIEIERWQALATLLL